MDQFLIYQFYQNHTIYDSARIKSLSGNGTLTWTGVAPNENDIGLNFRINNHW